MLLVRYALLAGSTALLLSCGPSRMPGTPSETAPVMAETSGEAVAGSQLFSPQTDFETQVRPILEACQPCHFAGGKMYEELPFDQPATIRKLGESLFTRIKDPEEQAVIRSFLAEQEPEVEDPSSDRVSVEGP